MGALIGLAVAERAPERVRSIALIDLISTLDPGPLELVHASLVRLDAVTPTPEEYVAAVRAAGAATPWSDFWERFYRYELAESEGGWSPTTSADACREDMRALDAVEASRRRWSSLTMPVLVVRGMARLGGGLFVPIAELDALRAVVPDVRVLEVERNHYGVMCDERVAEAIAELVQVGAAAR